MIFFLGYNTLVNFDRPIPAAAPAIAAVLPKAVTDFIFVPPPGVEERMDEDVVVGVAPKKPKAAKPAGKPRKKKNETQEEFEERLRQYIAGL